jgi:hypothetical protein
MLRDNRGSKGRLPSGHFWIALSLPLPFTTSNSYFKIKFNNNNKVILYWSGQALMVPGV